VVTVPAALDIKRDQEQPGALDAQEHIVCELGGAKGGVGIACAVAEMRRFLYIRSNWPLTDRRAPRVARRVDLDGGLSYERLYVGMRSNTSSSR
jgi:hypothetical protein